MSFLRLSLDLIRTIVDLVHDRNDTATLQSCMLINPAWWHASRTCVFSHITISDLNSLGHFERVLDDDDDIGWLVGTLVIRPANSKGVVMSYDWITQLVHKLPPRLLRLQTIVVAGFLEDGSVCTHDFFRAFSRFATVSMLRLHECIIELPMLYSLASSLPGLRQLHIGPIATSNNWRVDVLPDIPPPTLTGLSLAVDDCENEDMANILDWAVGHSFVTLCSLSLNIEYLQSDYVASFLEEHGALIRDLALRFVHSISRLWEYDLIKGEINLAHCTQLNSLEIHDFHPGSFAFVDLIEEISSPIRKLTVEFVSEDFEGGIPNFTSLGEALERPNVASLQTLAIVCQGLVGTGEIMSKLRLDMPEVCDRGIVQVFRNYSRVNSYTLVPRD